MAKPPRIGQDICRYHGFAVTGAECGQHAVEKAQACQPQERAEPAGIECTKPGRELAVQSLLRLIPCVFADFR
ncbi:MAG TPA: hypothetical protein VED46_06035 [Alphaproteobacteria bacterium]|nr:hypothetical protein [Alphaproteobacteria bacterium]